jgi:hypothetical protein
LAADGPHRVRISAPNEPYRKDLDPSDDDAVASEVKILRRIDYLGYTIRTVILIFTSQLSGIMHGKASHIHTAWRPKVVQCQNGRPDTGTDSEAADEKPSNVTRIYCLP